VINWKNPDGGKKIEINMVIKITNNITPRITIEAKKPNTGALNFAIASPASGMGMIRFTKTLIRVSTTKPNGSLVTARRFLAAVRIFIS
jgi:hypothetical protein